MGRDLAKHEGRFPFFIREIIVSNLYSHQENVVGAQ